ncbi:MAG: 2-oxo acid dehydrogenase subunit E2 [Chloroflexi bacterium]|nr:2-oxo acid dehydrogenase subunit E2 [Chloroflexota bacterium]
MATTIKMPQLGESVTEGTIERWLVKEGDTVEQYDPLFEVVTDKVNAEVPAEVAGTIAKILVPDGETVAVGTPVAEIDAEGAGAAAEPAAVADEAPTQEAAPAEAPAAEAEAQPAAAEATPEPAEEAPAQEQPAQESAPAQEQPAQAATSTETESASGDAGASGSNGDGNARMTPAVRRLVREHEIDVARLKGTGAGGRVTRDDVLEFINSGGAKAAAAEPAPAAQPPAAAEASAPAAQAAPAETKAESKPAAPAAPSPAPVPTAAGGDTEVPLSQMRKGIAKKMTQVKQTVPHAYTVVEVDMTNAVKWREANNAAFKAREGASLSFVAVVVKAVTETLRSHPRLNSQFADDKIILKQAMNIGIAVAVDNGLIVPVIANADQLSISGVNARIRDISGRAKSGKLRLDELQGGTFTVNNTGWFGSVSSMPIINAPEVAILSMEAIVKRPRVMEIDGEDVIAIRHMMNMTCSFDHRVLDGAQVGFFMADVRKALEEWDISTPLG